MANVNAVIPHIIGIQREIITKLRIEKAELVEAGKKVLEWHANDGSVGGCDIVMYDVLKPVIERTKDGSDKEASREDH